MSLIKPNGPLPPPQTFAEGQRLVYGLLASAGGMACGACAIAMIGLLMWGGWSQSEEHRIVTIFGWSLGGFIAAMIAVIVGLLAGGPVGRFKVRGRRQILRVLNLQGIVGLVATLALLGLLLTQKAETRHWRKQSNAFERLYHSEQAAFAGSVANYRAAADAARSADRAASEHARVEQNSINERTKNEFQARLADARAHAERLRRKSALASADRGGGGGPAMSSLSAPARGTAQAAGQDGLPPQDALMATELAIQLDELIKWVRAQADVDPNAVPSR